MTIPSVSIDETSPPGSQAIKQGDNRIREYKTQNREILEVDHEYPSSGQSATAGQHKQVTLQEQADIGTGASGVPILGGQTVSGKPELVYTDEDDNDVQITSGGALGAATQSVTCDDLTVGGLLTVDETITVSGVADFGGTLDVVGIVTMDDDASVGGDLAVTGSLTAGSGIAYITGLGAYETTDASQVGGSTTTLAVDTEYEAAVDGFVSCYVNFPDGNNYVELQVGLSSGSRTAVSKQGETAGGSSNESVTGFVAAGEFWYVDMSTTGTTPGAGSRPVFFKPLS